MRELFQSLSIKGRSWSLSGILAACWLLLLLLLVLFVDLLPLPYSPNALDLQHPYQRPDLESKHWLGTDQLGRDVAVNLLYGSRIAVLLSVPVMLLSTILGVIAGLSAGFYKNSGLRYTKAQIIGLAIFLFCSWFYGYYLQQPYFGATAGTALVRCLVTVAIVALLCFVLTKVLQLIPPLNKKRHLPLDSLVQQLIELITSLPGLLLIIALAAFARPSVEVVLVVVLLTYWTLPARLVRAEVLRLVKMPFLEAAVVLGLPVHKILLRQLLPNALPAVVVSLAFGIAGLMALESTLTFLGIGLPPDVPSWGRLLKGFRANMAAWWLLLLPGLFLTCSVLAVQAVSHVVLKMISK